MAKLNFFRSTDLHFIFTEFFKSRIKQMIWPTDILSIESWVLLGTLFALFRYYLHRKWQALKRWNIPHEPPSVLKMGNAMDFLRGRAFTYASECKEKFGPIYGLYIGTSPAIAVHDVDIMRAIYIKEFANFPNREVNQVQLAGKEMNTSVVQVRGAQWKRIRSTMSPIFSASKLRHMSGLLDQCSENLVQLLRKRIEAGGGEFKIRERFSSLSLDMVLSAAFSTDVNTQNDDKEEPEITKYAKQLFQFSLLSPIIFIVLMFPSTAKIFEKLNFTTMKKGPLSYFIELANMLMQRKIDDPHDQNRVDFMQLLLENRITDEDVAKGAEKGLTKNEIIGNSMVMILAGFENTANTMGFLAYNLATHPKIQSYLQSEIDEMIKEGGKFDYDCISGLKFLDMCMQESLRLYTPITWNARASKEEITINGLNIPAKTTITIPAYALAHDPEYWDEPHEFKPERMRDMSQIDPMYFQPFGVGPRNCIGMRFAMLEVKMVIAKLLYNFDLKPTAKTPKPPLKLSLNAGVRPKDEVELKAVPRSTDAADI